MRLYDILRIGMQQMLRARIQSKLTMGAVAIGVVSVVLISSLGVSASDAVSSELRRLGIDGLIVYLKESQYNGVPEEVADLLKERVPTVANAMPLEVNYGNYTLRGGSEDAAVLGVGAELDETLNLELLYGRVPSETDIQYGTNVVVVDDTLAQKYYKRSNIVGKTLRITVKDHHEFYTIIGVIASQKTGLEMYMGGNIPDFLYVPYTSYHGYSGYVQQVAVRCQKNVSTAAVTEDIMTMLSRYCAADGEYTVENISGYVERVENVARIISLFIAGVGAVSLLVAGFGVMNNMLGALNKRRREIGIYLAVGALRRDILLCYLSESVMLCFFGGLAGASTCGLIFGMLYCFGLAFPLRWDMLFLSLGVTVAFGLFFGLAPAFRASQMEPIDALRDDF